MPLDLQGFVAPVSKYEGLYKVGDDLQKNRLREEKEKQDDAANQMASSKYIENTLGKSQLFTGTPYDPIVSHLIAKGTSQFLEMSKNKVPFPSAQLAIQPIIDQIRNYTVNAKDYQIQKKSVLANARGIKGIDQAALSAEMDKTAFPVDPKTGIPDISQYDPNTDYADQVLKNGNVYNNEGISDFVGKAGKTTDNKNIKRYNANGGMYQTKADLTRPSFMQPEKDEKGVTTGFVPKYEIATDGDKELLHDFGEKGMHPVRMVTDEVFNSLPNTAKAYILQEVKKHASDAKIPINSAQAETLAKAMAYDELNNSGKNFSSIKNTSAQKENPVDKYYAHRDYAIAHPLPTHSAAAGEDNGNTNGVSYDTIGSTSPVEAYTTGRKFGIPFPIPVKVDKGIVYDKNGDKFTGDINIKKEDFPSDAIASLNKNNFNTGSIINATVKDGQIQSIQTKSGTVDRNSIQNFQKDIQIKGKIVPQKEFGKEAPALKTNKPVKQKQNANPLNLNLN